VTRILLFEDEIEVCSTLLTIKIAPTISARMGKTYGGIFFIYPMLLSF